eukprot:gene14096-5084_t
MISRQERPFEENSTSRDLVVEYGSLANILGKPFDIFSKYVRVFGLYFVATEDSPNDKLLHGATVFLQYIDNDGDNVPDNLLVYQSLLKIKATMVMFRDEKESLQHRSFLEEAVNIGVQVQDLEADEILVPGKFDEALEECFHLLTKGYSVAYPDIFGFKRGSYLANCCDKARGGHFKTVPPKYPPGAWFTYYDNTCGYPCQIIEYIYWAMTSILGLQKDRAEVLHEWRLNTPELVEKGDPAVYALLTDKQFKLPTKSPLLKAQCSVKQKGSAFSSQNFQKTFPETFKTRRNIFNCNFVAWLFVILALLLCILLVTLFIHFASSY